MYSYSADELACVVVSVWSGEQRDADFIQSIEQIQRTDKAAAARGIDHVQFAIIENGYKSPPAIWRQRMSEVNRELACSRYYFALITESAVIRGVFTAVRWLIGARKGHHSAAFESFDAAAAWVRQVTGNSYPQLEMHYGRALYATSSSLGRAAGGS